MEALSYDYYFSEDTGPDTGAPNNKFMLSTSVGSGKTTAAIEYMLHPAQINRNFVYVAPTLSLVKQTVRDLRRVICERKGLSRNVHSINSEDEREISTWQAALEALNTLSPNTGKVVVLTTTTYLSILPMINQKATWNVILDEAFSPLSFKYFKLGDKKERERGLEYFDEVFSVDKDSKEVTAADGKGYVVNKIAVSDYDSVGARYQGLHDVAKAVANPAIKCELVLKTKTKLSIATYVNPKHFDRFNEVVFMAALFEHTNLYHLWTRMYGAEFKYHDTLERLISTNVHVAQGRCVSVGHLLHPRDKSSRYTLERDYKTGQPKAKKGSRVIDSLLSIVEDYLSGQEYLLQVNNWLGITERKKDGLPKGAELIPVVAHGLNKYKTYTHCVALATTNPDKVEAKWIMDKTGLSAEEMYQAYRIHSIYQAFGRTAIRDRDDDRPKVFICLGYEDARFIHSLFKGSNWLGQIGGMGHIGGISDQCQKPKLSDDPKYITMRGQVSSIANRVKRGTLPRSELDRIKKEMMEYRKRYKTEECQC